MIGIENLCGAKQAESGNFRFGGNSPVMRITASVIRTLAFWDTTESEIGESFFEPLTIRRIILRWCLQAYFVDDARSQCDNFLLDDATFGKVILALETGGRDRAHCGFVAFRQLEVLFIPAGQIDLLLAYSI